MKFWKDLIVKEDAPQYKVGDKVVVRFNRCVATIEEIHDRTYKVWIERWGFFTVKDNEILGLWKDLGESYDDHNKSVRRTGDRKEHI